MVWTGASGVLGSAVYKAFKSASHSTIGLAHSRAREDLLPLDLTDEEAVQTFLQVAEPDCQYPIFSVPPVILIRWDQGLFIALQRDGLM